MTDLIHSHLLMPLCHYLQDALAARPEAVARDVFVGRKMPAERRNRMVILANRGGHRVDLVTRRTIVDAVVWADDPHGVDADDLSELVAALFEGANSGLIVDVEVVTSPQDVTDPSGHERRFMRLAVLHRAIPGA